MTPRTDTPPPPTQGAANIATQLEGHTVPIDDLVPYYQNPRRGNVEVIAESLRINGQYKPVTVNVGTVTKRRNEVLAGNHTLLAAKRLGWDRLAATFVDVDNERAARIVAVDNASADQGSYDETLLLQLLEDLPDLAGTGYDSTIFDQLRPPDEPAQLTDPDELPEIPEPAEATTQLGDVWLLGDHRLIVGDCTDPAVIEALMAGELADCLWTDPPYGVDVVTGSRATSNAERRAAGGKTIRADKHADVARTLAPFLRCATAALRQGAPAYIAHPSTPSVLLQFGQAIVDAGWSLRQQLVWRKDSLVVGQSDYHYQHETLWLAYTPVDGPGHGKLGRNSKHWHGDDKSSSVFDVPRPKRADLHPTMKPVDLIVAHLRNSCKPGGLVLDTYAGSGSTMIAAHQLGRRANLVELDPVWADVICRRWQAHTGAMPARPTGETVDFAAPAAS